MCHQITALYYVMALVIYKLQSNVWLGHDTNSSIGSVLVKGLNLWICLLMIIQLTYIVCSTGITVWLGLIIISISVAKEIIIITYYS